ncbi:carbohydrate-binding protein [Streptomyces sp. ISL-36]|uniref:CBM35 domain-containing protein n=1 Tax=Streptomyces sp. ISL-36 TaxID=2819182 RepID=UPI001BE8C82A|nr:CBM35 domain-containing protein [Streptomyces sp. ISL-36]MBT2439656.1 carbohydrate-binding protein [Streptomyces sp. ISL-36]
MAAGNNGANTPEDDDPFGYLYADGQAAGAQPPGQGGGYGYPGPAAQPGVPRTSYNQVRTVGERQYGGQQQYGQHGQGHVPQQQTYGGQQQYGQPNPQYGQPSPQYAAPETYPGGERTRQAPIPHQRGGGGRGPNTKGLLIGAIAVVLVVVIGITAALISNTGGEKTDGGTAGGKPTGDPTQVQEDPSSQPSADKTAQVLPQQDAATLKLGGSALLAKDIKGAEGADGAYVTGFNAIGSSVTWQADLEEAGDYYLYVRYAIPAKDANATLTVNDKPNGSPLGLKNFISSTDPNLEKNWQTTWAPVSLKQGKNTIKLSCEQGNQCDAIFDWLKISKTKLSG